MPRVRPNWKSIRASREHGVSRYETMLGYILEAAEPPSYHAFVKWNREPKDDFPGINADTGPVTIYGPDGMTLEKLSAKEFRRRYSPRLRAVRR